MASPWRAQRARTVILAALVMVLAGTVASYLYRRRSRRPVPPGPAPIAEAVGQQTHSFSLSKTLGEHTLYTIHAEQVTNYEDTGKALLHNVSVLIYGKDGSRRDLITSPESYYDPAASSVWIPGEVEMQFGLPTPEAGPDGPQDGTAIPISIFTSKLSFEQSTGVASTDAPVRFVFAQGAGTSDGASYDPEKQILTLKSNVRFDVGGQPPAGGSTNRRGKSGRSRPGERTLVRAGTVHFVRETGRAVLENSVEITRGPRQIRAAQGEIELDDHLHVRQATLAGGVIATEETAAELRQARAESGAVLFNELGRIHSLDLSRDVSWSIESRLQRKQRAGRAQHVELLFRDVDGGLETARAEQDVRMTFSGPASRTSPADSQILSGGAAEMTMAPDGKTMREVRIRSAPKLEILPADSGADRRTVMGEEFQIGLDEGGELSQFRAQGQVRVVSEGMGSPTLRRESTSDSLEASFNSLEDSVGSLDRIRQWGHFEYRDPERQARAEEANYELASETVVLSGKPAIWNSDGRLTATRIELEMRSGGVKAEGNVSSTFFQKSSAGNPPPQPLHVVADRLRYQSSARRSSFEGHARLWQGESFLVEASQLDWSQQTGELNASKKVYSVFQRSPNGNAGMPSPVDSGAKDHKDPSIVIAANSLVYQQQRGLARYEGDVRMQSASGVLTASELEIFLGEPAAPPSADLLLSTAQIKRAVAQHQVKIVEGGRVATGDWAEYLPARNEVHLYGQLAKVADAARGTVEGAELTYFLGDDRIQVQGSPGSPTETRWQVHP